jgi:uncharacterized protein (DUF302 family)
MRSLALMGLILVLLGVNGAWAAQGTQVTGKGKVKAPPAMHSLGDTVVKLPLAKGVSLEDAAQSMKLRANYLNMQLVAELPLSKQVAAITGKAERHATIFQFCDAMTARKMLDYSLDFAAYLPCRIALVEDEKGQGWLVMMDLNLLIIVSNLQPEL